MDKTETTVKAYNACAADFTAKFMDLALYKDSLNHFINLVPAGAKILDAGCGPGNIARLLLEKQKGFRVSGFDLSPEMVKLAINNVPGASFQIGDIRNLSSWEPGYDAIIAAFSIVHLSNDETLQFIRNVSCLLKAEGLFYLSCIQGDHAGYATTSFSRKEIYFNRFSRNFILTALTGHNFNIVNTFSQAYPEPDGTTSTELFFYARKMPL
ncbi:s-adenosyl-l-methionine-dependent methyltransferase [Lucifera butyrica]|uniref:S-adenosyl-l-methionine-dependent methyltransferase n=1 Tax=Lucifera butyrica TaxID=1351585 RepID=A0A498R7C1_9FIRM|nr:class I SAM-dependent methyltransferase [Lucifera butyrica]VBB05028.1 s-adenosyl-l-methionine-dependent methyltransferase [Lucifera butyrica]